MSDAALRAKLERLRRPGAGGHGAVAPAAEPAEDLAGPGQPLAPLVVPATGSAGLGRLAGLERALLGADADLDGLSLKARLERLVAVAAQRERRSRPGVRPLEELVPGEAVATPRGEYYRTESDVHLDAFHGSLPLARLRSAQPEALRILAGEAGLDGFPLEAAAYLDTETTGLAGGSGTAAFLIGLGFVRDGRFVVRQYFMRDYNEEPAMLAALAGDLAGFRHVVTFNGKMFDLPLLEARYRMNRARFPLEGAAHLDLLHPARRLWKLRLDSCRLQSLEVALLGLTRHGDIPGEEIPHVYFRYVRTRDARALARIFQHNHTDIVSLAALAALACEWVSDGRAEDPRDVFSLARVFERAQLYERCESEYRRALDGAQGGLRTRALVRLAVQAKRSGDVPRAAELWEQAAAAGECEAFRELAVLHERRRRDPSEALRVVERAFRELAGREERCCRRALAQFERRRERLLAKLARAGAASAPARAAGSRPPRGSPPA